MKYYTFLGKKWVYPILFHLKNNKGYRFEDFVSITERKMSRSILSKFISTAVELSLLKKEDKKYYLTELGIDVKKKFLDIKDTLRKYHNISCDTTQDCVINIHRV